ncbi:hypothetical protein AB434_2179 [Heyndrickxia coagulans]|jgi:hypothetical protein|nr:hypothetical protein AB434_2179 [Heyndrickxia coagulans]KYC90588.1 hypothetical protein B4096_0455 [Heyndrickxia coagulans]
MVATLIAELISALRATYFTRSAACAFTWSILFSCGFEKRAWLPL